MPDFTTVANELWVIIFIFIFQIFNNLRFSEEKTERRKQNYLKSRYLYFKRLYGKLIKEMTNNEILESIVYSILIYEDFNRPKIARIIENLKFKLTKKSHTLGVMQVKTNKFIDDYDSIINGTMIIIDEYKNYIKELKDNDYQFYEEIARSSIISKYNTGENYTSEVFELNTLILKNFYLDTKDTLDPNKNAL